MATFNQATVIGYVCNEPRIIQTQSNNAMASFSIATTDKGYTKRDGTVVPDRTEWHNIVFFERAAEVIGQYVHKGSMLFVQGKMRTRSYLDKQNVKHYVTEIIGDDFQILDRKNDAQQAQTQANVQQPQQPMPF